MKNSQFANPIFISNLYLITKKGFETTMDVPETIYSTTPDFSNSVNSNFDESDDSNSKSNFESQIASLPAFAHGEIIGCCGRAPKVMD